MALKNYEIAILLQMYNEGLISHNYKALQQVRSKIQWRKIASKYRVKEPFDKIARRLVKRRLLSNDGKSMAVLSLGKLGVDFVRVYLKKNPNAMDDLGI